jgi:hypothetical protein
MYNNESKNQHLPALRDRGQLRPLCERLPGVWLNGHTRRALGVGKNGCAASYHAAHPFI